MNLIITSEFRFYQTPDGDIWTPSSFPYEYWLRYLTAFENIIVIARVQLVNQSESTWSHSNGKNVSFFNLPYYVGFTGLLKNSINLFCALKEATKLKGLFLCRVPSQTASVLTFLLGKKRNYALEVVGDPYDVFSTGIGGKHLAPILKSVSKNILQKQCKNALGASYVTESYLQKRYPAGPNTHVSFYSSIMLDKSQIIPKARHYTEPARKLIFIGSLDQLYKAPDVLLSSFSKLFKDDKNYHLTMLGTGKFKAKLVKLADNLGISSMVNFAGEVSSTEVENYLQQADVFVLPSRTEGLPRAIIEAMAKGLPCVGSTAGGIPELLQPEFCINIAKNSSLTLSLNSAQENDEKESIMQLYSSLRKLCNNTTILNAQSKRSISKAHEYSSEFLSIKRTHFYKKIRELNQ
jgi:glycosyltransferase involved in cell wall biosynthesis